MNNFRDKNLNDNFLQKSVKIIKFKKLYFLNKYEINKIII